MTTQTVKPEVLKLKMSEVVELYRAYQAFGGFNKVSAKSDEVSVIPYDIGGMTRLAIAMNAATLRPLSDAHTETITKLGEQHLPGSFDPKSATSEERLARIAAMAEYQKEVKAAESVEVEVKQRKIPIGDLKLDKNPIDPNVLLLLTPVLVEDVEEPSKSGP